MCAGTGSPSLEIRHPVFRTPSTAEAGRDGTLSAGLRADVAAVAVVVAVAVAVIAVAVAAGAVTGGWKHIEPPAGGF